MPLKIPVPDAFRINYPHFIATPSILRCCYVFIATLSVMVFIASVVFYYEFDEEHLSEIAFTAKADWECVSIGAFNGDYSLLPGDNVTWDLSKSTAIGSLNSYSAQPQVSVYTGPGALDISTYSLHTSYDTDADAIRTTFTVNKGNVPTLDGCINTFHDNSCSFSDNNDIFMQDLSLYKFTYDVSVINTSSNIDINSFHTLTLRNRYTSSTIYMGSESFDSFIHSTDYQMNNYVTSNELFTVVSFHHDSYDNLCDTINNNKDMIWSIMVQYDLNDDSDADADLWVFPYPEVYDPWYRIDEGLSELSPNVKYPDINMQLNVECELIANDYCIVDTTEQFVFGKQELMKDNQDMEIKPVDDTFALYMLLGSELGTECADRWHNVCTEQFDIEGLCQSLYISPFSCIKTEKKSYWAILSLSFAAAELVFTVLVALISFGCRRFGKPVWEKEMEDGMNGMNKLNVIHGTPTASTVVGDENIKSA